MKRWALFCLAFLFAVLLSLPALALTEEERLEKISNFTAYVLNSFGEDTQTIIKTLGEPSSMETTKEANIHEPDFQNTIDTLVYEDMTLSTIATPHKSFVVALECSSKQYALAKVQVGANVNDVVKELGDPNEKTETTVSYETDYSSLTFTVDKSGTIEMIQALLFLD
ncbi:MAG: DUF3862 domain-containing protein [Fretibacterium sp.]|nr:DUF3862 domain-containing protein [Fretibacterium sp.]